MAFVLEVEEPASDTPRQQFGALGQTFDGPLPTVGPYYIWDNVFGRPCTDLKVIQENCKKKADG